MVYKLLPFSLLISLQLSCTQFPSRSYIEQMDIEDHSFFSPSEDFPVVSGDNGKDWISFRERLDRTPAADVIMAEERSARALKSELKELEYIQPEEDLEFYDAHKHKFRSASEKIFFLNLPVEERRDYLVDRGFLPQNVSVRKTDFINNKSGGSPDSINQSSFEPRIHSSFYERQDHLTIGMSKNDVLNSFGKPLLVEIAGNPRNENERWLYEMNGASKYIYFESGEVHGWE